MRDAIKPSARELIGALLMLVATPAGAYYLYLCVRAGGALQAPSFSMLADIPAPSVPAALFYGAWLLLQAVLQIVAPGQTREGAPLADGRRLRYRLNGWFSFWFTLALAVLMVLSGWVRATILYDEFGPLLTTANIFAFAFCVFLYLHGVRSKRPERRSGNALVDYVMGSELNPRLGQFDLKFFCEARPGLILWVLINLSFAARQYELYAVVTTPMILVLAFQFLYVADYFYFEEAILSTWDIRHENFGWMLAWGCLVWVPFTYTLQAHYLVQHTHDLSIAAVVALVVLNMAGYVIFRGANLQKHRFRRDPGARVWGKPAEYIQTAYGTRLLTSGWWGVARHSNYLGDLIMAFAWCLPAGFSHPLPYFYFFYFTGLLVHRAWRDNERCREKYGRDWQEYCRRVPWRILPGVY
jgi:protein-S-isoprenylcysteine O-methyltransferase Ste14